MKYIVVLKSTLLIPIVFPEVLSHAEAAGTMQVVSAGFVYLDKGLVVVTNEPSISLNKIPNPVLDRQLIVSLLKNMGSYAFDTNLIQK